jgi:hypothetical protein
MEIDETKYKINRNTRTLAAYNVARVFFVHCDHFSRKSRKTRKKHTFYAFPNKQVIFM